MKDYVKNFESRNLEAEKLINKASIEHRHAIKTGNEGLADKISAKLKDDLEAIEYNWQQDPYAIELLGDYIGPADWVHEGCDCDKKEPKAKKIPKSISSRKKEKDIEDYYGGYDDKKKTVKTFEEFIIENETIEDDDEEPWYEPEWCEDCSAECEENGIEYEANFTWKNGCWHCDSCGRPV